MHPTQHLKSHCHVQPAARASVSLSMTLQEHRARVRLQNLSQFRTFPCIVPPNRKAAIFSPTVREEPFLQPHIAESTTTPSQFRTFPCIVPPSHKAAMHHFFTHWQRGTIFAATFCRIHDNPKPVQNIPLHSPAKPEDSGQSSAQRTLQSSGQGSAQARLPQPLHPQSSGQSSAQRTVQSSGQSSAQARTASTITSLRRCPSQSEKKRSCSAWSHNHVELSANDCHRAHLTPRQVYHEI
jgi:hypothetical protein